MVTGILAFLVLLLVLLPFGIEWWLEDWMIERGAVTAEVLNVDFNPFNGELVLEGVRAADPESGRLTLERAAVEIDWWPLFRRRVYLHDLAVKNGHIDLWITEEGVPVIGPLRFGGGEEEVDEDEPFGFGMEGIALEQIRIDYRDPRIRRDIVIDRLGTEGLFTWEPEQESPFLLALAVGEGTFRIEGTTRPFATPPSVDARLEVNDFPIAWIEPLLEPQGIAAFDGRLQAEADLRFVFHGSRSPGLEMNFDGTTGLEEVRIEGPGYRLPRGNLRWKGAVDWLSAPAPGQAALEADGEASLAGVELKLAEKDLALWLEGLVASGTATLPGGKEAALSLDCSLEARGFRLDDKRKGLNLLSFEELVGEEIRMAGTAAFTAGSVRADRLALLQQPEGTEEGGEPILTFEALEAREVELRNLQRLTIAGLRAAGARLELVREPSGALGLEAWTGDKSKEDPAVSEKGSGKNGAFSVAIGEASVAGGSRFVFVDRKLDPAFAYELEVLRLTLGRLDSDAPERPSPVRLETRRGKYGAIELSGKVFPFSDPFALDLSGRIQSLELPQLTLYVRQFIGYRVLNGHLDADLAVAVDKGDLDVEAELVLTRFDVEPVPETGATEEVNRRLGVPLESALALLRDRDDTITLDIAVDGDLDNPQFNVADLVMTVLVKAVKKGMVSYYAPVGLSMLTGAAVPIGITYVAGKLLNLVTALRFDPVLFPPLKAELDPGSRERLKEIAERLKDRPKVRLILCGKATMTEMQEEGNGKPLSAEQMEHLRRMAEQRSRAVKNLLVEEGIEAGRLLVCSPEVESGAGTRPRVEIGI